MEDNADLEKGENWGGLALEISKAAMGACIASTSLPKASQASSQ